MTIVTSLNKLPVVVIEPGMYNTRNGRKALVTEVKSNDPTVTQFSVKGTLFAKTGKPINYYSVWHISGRLFWHMEHALDLVSKVENNHD